MSIIVSNILDLVKENGEDSIAEFLSDFSCEKEDEGKKKSLNPDVEHFLKQNAISFAQKKISVSYVVTDEDDGAVLGYFTLAHKSLEMPATGLSKSTRRIMERYSQLKTETDTYLVSAFLLAQFAKNYAVENGNRITGHELMSFVASELSDIQHRIGGGVEYLDCEANAELIRFYEGEGFKLFGERISENDGKRYLQYMRFF